MILPFDYNGYKRLSENKRFPNHRWYSDATWGEMDECSPFNSPVTCLTRFMFYSLEVDDDNDGSLLDRF